MRSRKFDPTKKNIYISYITIIYIYIAMCWIVPLNLESSIPLLPCHLSTTTLTLQNFKTCHFTQRKWSFHDFHGPFQCISCRVPYQLNQPSKSTRPRRVQWPPTPGLKRGPGDLGDLDICIGGWPTPLNNMSSSVGMMTFPINMESH